MAARAFHPGPSTDPLQHRGSSFLPFVHSSYSSAKPKLAQARHWRAHRTRDTSVSGYLGLHARHSPQRRRRHLDMEMVRGHEVLFTIRVQSATPGLAPTPRLRENLGNLGTAPCQVIPLACGAMKALDSRQAIAPWARCSKTLLPVRPRAGNH